MYRFPTSSTQVSYSHLKEKDCPNMGDSHYLTSTETLYYVKIQVHDIWQSYQLFILLTVFSSLTILAQGIRYYSIIESHLEGSHCQEEHHSEGTQITWGQWLEMTLGPQPVLRFLVIDTFIPSLTSLLLQFLYWTNSLLVSNPSQYMTNIQSF